MSWLCVKTLPYNSLNWHYGKSDEMNAMIYSDNDDIGYILDVDLDLPKNCMLYIRITH